MEPAAEYKVEPPVRWKSLPLPWPETIREAIAAAVRASDGSKSQQRRIEILRDLLETAEAAWK